MMMDVSMERGRHFGTFFVNSSSFKQKHVRILMRRPCRLVDFKLISRLFHEDDLEWLFQFGYEALIRGHSGAPAAAAGI